VASLDQTVLEGLRRMALSVPSGDGSQASAVVVGRWSGTMQETGQAVRTIQVRFFRQGSGLGGALTTQSGSIRGELPLQDVRFDGRRLSFVLDVGSSPRRFRGVFEGSAIGGTLHPRRGSEESLGRFLLRYER
jgi:hypothetical protein